MIDGCFTTVSKILWLNAEYLAEVMSLLIKTKSKEKKSEQGTKDKMVLEKNEVMK